MQCNAALRIESEPPLEPRNVLIFVKLQVTDKDSLWWQKNLHLFFHFLADNDFEWEIPAVASGTQSTPRD